MLRWIGTNEFTIISALYPKGFGEAIGLCHSAYLGDAAGKSKLNELEMNFFVMVLAQSLPTVEQTKADAEDYY